MRRKFKRRKFSVKKRRVPKSTKKYVKAVINKNIETKYYDGTIISQGVDWNGVVFGPITDIPQGDTDSNRIGDKVNLKSLRMRFTIQWADTINLMRIVVFQWIPTSLTLPSVADIFPASNLGNFFSPLLNYVWDDKSQRIILYDKVFRMVSNNDSGFTVHKKKVSLKFAKKKVNFIAGSNDGYNHLFILAISDSGAAAHPNLQLVRRVTYKDA